jgi:two-component system NarL family response regulator
MKDRIRFEISDEGKGFDPTARAANNHYGLDIMRARAQQSGGIFSVKSTPGMGVRIILEYPIPTRSQDSVPSPTATNPEGAQDNWHEPAGHGQAKGLDNSRHPASILVVDDHDLFREGLCGLLRLGGFNVVGSVASAEIGLVLARNSALDIVLMDIQMRGMDGIQATARFKDEFPSIRIILLTGSPYPGDVLRATQVGASAFLNKSVQASELFETIVEVLQGQARFGPEIAKQILANYSTEYGGTSPLRLIEPLNVRQREVLKLVAQGLTYKEIGTRLHLAESTIKFHMGDIVMLLHVRNKAEAARVAREAGM